MNGLLIYMSNEYQVRLLNYNVFSKGEHPEGATLQMIGGERYYVIVSGSTPRMDNGRENPREAIVAAIGRAISAVRRDSGEVLKDITLKI